MNNETRQMQRFESFLKAYALFERTLDWHQDNLGVEVGQLAITQAFEMVVELSWKLMKGYLENKGVSVESPKDVIKQAFQSEVIRGEDGEIWMEAIDRRNDTSHFYNEVHLHKLVAFIDEKFVGALQRLHIFFENELDNS